MTEVWSARLRTDGRAAVSALGALGGGASPRLQERGRQQPMLRSCAAWGAADVDNKLVTVVVAIMVQLQVTCTASPVGKSS